MVGNIKHIIVIESLKEEDGIIYTGEALYNDTIKRRIDLFEKDFKHKLHKVVSKEEFTEIIKYYQENSPYMNGGIVLHFEIHGDEDLKGLILSDGSLIIWGEIIELLRPINIETCNKLFITMGTCNGRFLYKGVDPYKKSPYSGYISASKTVEAEEIYIKFGKLFEELINNGNIVEAYNEMEKTESNFYYKDSKASFEEAFETTMNDTNLQEDILKDARAQTKKATGYEPTEIESKLIHKKALHNLFKRQYDAFDFTDCD